jgi:integrase
MGVYKKESNWFIDYRFKGKRIREKVGPSKRMAQQALAARKGEIAQDRFSLSSVHKTPTLSDFSKEYLEYSRANKKSSRRDAISLGHLLSFFKDHGIVYLGDVTGWHIEKYKAWRKSVVSAKTVKNEIGCLSHVFTMAIKWGKVQENPTKGVQRIKANNDRVRFLTKEEILRLLASCSEEIQPIVQTALNTGMRMGELLGLRWEDVDLANDVLTLHETKSGTVQHVLINSPLHELFARANKAAEGPFVFGGEKPLHEKWVRRRFYRALGQAGIKDFRFHDLRHTFASHLVMSGVDLLTVKELMRHSDVSMTMKYAHLSRDHKRRAIEVIYSGHYMDTIEKDGRLISTPARG